MLQSIDEKRQQHRSQGIVKSVGNDKRNQGLILGFEKIYAQKQDIDCNAIKLAEGKPHGGKKVNCIKKQDIDQNGDRFRMAYSQRFL